LEKAPVRTAGPEANGSLAAGGSRRACGGGRADGAGRRRPAAAGAGRA
jgi:hypothetical protein